MKTRLYAAMATMLLLTSCGQQHKAEAVVEEFMNAHVKDAKTLQITEFDKIDSTRYINDSIVTALRESTKRSPVYKDNIEYGQTNGRKLMMLRVKYNINNAKHQDTYYINDSITRVIAVKCN